MKCCFRHRDRKSQESYPLRLPPCNLYSTLLLKSKDRQTIFQVPSISPRSKREEPEEHKEPSVKLCSASSKLVKWYPKILTQIGVVLSFQKC